MMKQIICWLTQHSWEPNVVTKEWWHTFEDITDTGGLTLGYGRGKGSGNEFEESYEVESTSRHCSFCNKTEWL